MNTNRYVKNETRAKRKSLLNMSICDGLRVTFCTEGHRSIRKQGWYGPFSIMPDSLLPMYKLDRVVQCLYLERILTTILRFSLPGRSRTIGLTKNTLDAVVWSRVLYSHVLGPKHCIPTTTPGPSCWLVFQAKLTWLRPDNGVGFRPFIYSSLG